jgi:hypothetical protein
LISWKPGSGSVSACGQVIVSPTGAPCTSLMPAMTKPTSPAPALRCLALRREHADLIDLMCARST